MKKSIICAIALLASMNARAAQYIFANVTGHLLPGYKVEIRDPKDNLLATLENGKSAYVRDCPSYQLRAFSDSKKKGNPLNFTPSTKDTTKNVIIVKFGKMLNHIRVSQTTLEKAKKEYGKRVQFPA